MDMTKEEKCKVIENLFLWRSTLVQKEWFIGGRHYRDYRYTTIVPLYYNKDGTLEFEASDVGMRILLLIKQNNGPTKQFCLYSNYCICGQYYPISDCCACHPSVNHSISIYDYYEYLEDLEENERQMTLV
jgi:hypothetical protein